VPERGIEPLFANFPVFARYNQIRSNTLKTRALSLASAISNIVSDCISLAQNGPFLAQGLQMRSPKKGSIQEEVIDRRCQRQRKRALSAAGLRANKYSPIYTKES